jgi:hypothetical protein
MQILSEGKCGGILLTWVIVQFQEKSQNIKCFCTICALTDQSHVMICNWLKKTTYTNHCYIKHVLIYTLFIP